MAKKASNSDKKVTRISASESTSPKKEKPAKITAAKKAVKKTDAKDKKPKEKKESRGIIGYFKGAWYELKQVRWPTRGATWSLTFAVLAFSAFFILFIFLVDTLFKYLFDLILK